MKWNEEEIRAAIEKVAVKYSPHIESSVPQLIADGALAELTKPAIHPDVPVYRASRVGSGRTNILDYAGDVDPSDTNIRPLVPTEAVIRWMDDGYSVRKGIDHYIATGKTE